MKKSNEDIREDVYNIMKKLTIIYAEIEKIKEALNDINDRTISLSIYMAQETVGEK